MIMPQPRSEVQEFDMYIAGGVQVVPNHERALPENLAVIFGRASQVTEVAPIG